MDEDLNSDSESEAGGGWFQRTTWHKKLENQDDEGWEGQEFVSAAILGCAAGEWPSGPSSCKGMIPVTMRGPTDA
jgi:hypothetical protein